MKERKQKERKLRCIKVLYAARRRQEEPFQETVYTQIPRISMEGGWLEKVSFDDLFGEQEDMGGERIKEALLEELYPFKDHPFKVQDDAGMEDMAESIRKYGVLAPGIVRIRPSGGYELIAGHRRRHASMLAGKETMPVIIRELDDKENSPLRLWRKAWEKTINRYRGTYA